LRVAILGAGNVGSLVAYELSRDFEVWVASRSESSLAKLKNIVHTVKLDASNTSALRDFAKGFDIVVNALPGVQLLYKFMLFCGHCLILVPPHPTRVFIGLGGVQGHPEDPTS